MRKVSKLISFLLCLAIVSAYAISKLPKDFISPNIPATNKINSFLIDSGLGIGSQGDQVKIIQIALGMDVGLYPEKIVSGYYGELTKKAVARFQDKYGLTQTGSVDQPTADKFNMVYGNNSAEYYLALVPTPQLVEIQMDNPVDSEEWGKATQISEHTWTMRIAMDAQMATPREILEALNSYRVLHGRNSLYWDDRLAKYAQIRAQYFTQLQGLDEHAGFEQYLKSEENVRSLGFWSLGENSSYGYRLSGTHLIEWIYAGDKPHDDNQLSSDWTHVGIGVDGNQSDLIFGGHQI